MTTNQANQEKLNALVTACLRKLPSMGEILLFIKLVAKDDLNNIAQTDGQSIEFGPKFFKYSVPQQAFILFHEVLHVALRHAKRLEHLIKSDNDVISPHLIWNLAADAVINECLTLLQDDDIKRPNDCVLLSTLEQDFPGLNLNKKQDHEWTSEELYTLLRQAVNNKPPCGGGSGSGKQGRSSQSGQDSVLNKIKEWQDLVDQDLGNGQPDYLDNEGLPSAESDEINAKIWSERLDRAIKGTGNAGLIKKLTGELPRVKTPWQRVLREFLNNRLLPTWESSHKMPSRRSLAGVVNHFEPARLRQRGIQKVALLLDVSGSCWDNEVFSEFVANVQQVQRVANCTIVLIPFEYGEIKDEDVHLIKNDGRTLSQKLLTGEVSIKGGGGTSFVEPLNKAAKYNPEVVIALTDGYGDFPEKCPVNPNSLLWAMNSNEVAPYGRTLKIEKD